MGYSPEEFKCFDQFMVEGIWSDGEVICRDCKNKFTITWLQAKNFFMFDQCIPKRCPECREKRKRKNLKTL